MVTVPHIHCPFTGVFVASFTKELFLHFESESYDDNSTVLPADIDWHTREHRRHQYASQYKSIVSVQGSSLLITDRNFNIWYTALTRRLCTAWAGGDWNKFNKLFVKSFDPKVEQQLLESAKQVSRMRELLIFFASFLLV